MYVGFVTDNADPAKKGRVLVRVPGFLDPPVWADVVMLGSPFSNGVFAIPTVGSAVLVGFIQGDFSEPVVLGGFSPPPTSSGLRAQLEPEDVAKLITIDNDTWSVILGAPGSAFDGLAITSRSDPKVAITLDRQSHAIKIEATVSVEIDSTGAIRIDGNVLQLGQRPVATVGGPI